MESFQQLDVADGDRVATWSAQDWNIVSISTHSRHSMALPLLNISWGKHHKPNPPTLSRVGRSVAIPQSCHIMRKQYSRVWKTQAGTELETHSLLASVYISWKICSLLVKNCHKQSYLIMGWHTTLPTCQIKHVCWCNSNTDNMGATNWLPVDLRPSLEKGICVWDCKPGQRPIAGEITDPTGEDTAFISLSGYGVSIKWPSKHPYIIVAVSLSHRGKIDFAISSCYYNP